MVTGSLRAVSQPGRPPVPALTWALACPGLAGRCRRPGPCPSCVVGPATGWPAAPRVWQLDMSGAELGVPVAGRRRPQRRLAHLGPSAGPPSSSGEHRSVPTGPVLGRGRRPQPPLPPQVLALTQLVSGPRAALSSRAHEACQWSARDGGLAEPFRAALQGPRAAGPLVSGMPPSLVRTSGASGWVSPWQVGMTCRHHPGSIGAGGLGAPSRVCTTHHLWHTPPAGPPPPEPCVGGQPGSECAGSPSSDPPLAPRRPCRGPGGVSGGHGSEVGARALRAGL